MKRVVLTMCLLVMALTGCTNQNLTKKEGGYVPNEETAIAIAEAVLIPVYGKEKIISERPFTAVLKEGVWIVRGHLDSGMLGGVAEVRISKEDGRILFLTHYA